MKSKNDYMEQARIAIAGKRAWAIMLCIVALFIVHTYHFMEHIDQIGATDSHAIALAYGHIATIYLFSTAALFILLSITKLLRPKCKSEWSRKRRDALADYFEKIDAISLEKKKARLTARQEVIAKELQKI